MKKHPGKLRFLGGFLSATLAFSLAASSLAFSGQVSFGGVNIAMFGQKKVDAADDFATVGGAQVPSSLTYTDENGGDTVYLPMRLMAELLDADIAWRADSKTADFGSTTESCLNITANGEPIYSTGDTTTPPLELVDTPMLGVNNGPFTEVTPKLGKGNGVEFLKDADFSSVSGFMNQRYYVDPQYDYIEITITNHGDPVKFSIVQADMLLGVGKGRFSVVQLDAGESITRAFTVEDSDTMLSRWLDIDINAITSDKSNTDITADIVMYFK